MQNQVLLSAHLHRRMDYLVDHMVPRFYVSQMWSHWLLPQLLEQDVHQTIENSGSIEELLEDLVGLVWCLSVDVVDQRKREILIDSHIVLLVLQDLLFSLSIGHGCNLVVVDFTLLW